MPAGKLFYALAAASFFSTFVLTILNALMFATLQSLPFTPSTGITALGLSLISCVTLIVTSVLLHKNVRNSLPWPYWKTCVLCFMGVYLIIAAGITAGIMESPRNSDQTMLCLVRSIFWAFSIFTQGLYCGFLLVASSQKRSDATWPRQMKPLPDSSSPTTPPQTACDPYPEMGHFDTRRSSLRKYPRRSNRYSGGTLCLQTSTPDKCASFDTASTISSPEHSPTHEKMPGAFLEHDARPLLRSSHSIRSMPSLRAPRGQQSLDTLVQPSPSESVETLTPSREHHIHPLFRSTSPSPSPMPTARTRVQASPSAGQTITKNTLTRMRSARSLRDPSVRTSSPLPGPEDDGPSGPGLSFIHVGHVRRSITQYEQRHEIYESPDEN